MAKPPTLAGAVELGMGWYRPKDWDWLLEVITDRDKLHDSYAEWLASAEQGERGAGRARPGRPRAGGVGG